MPSPPKPWERGTSAALVTAAAPEKTASSLSGSVKPTITPSIAPTSATSSATTPSVPARPIPLANASQPTLTQNSYAPSYGYSSPYSRFGSSYSPYGTGGLYGGGMGYGSYGMNSMYGGMPGYGGIGGMGGMGGIPYGSPYDPNAGAPSLTQSLSSTTQHTFALLHSIVQTFSGLAQMLESTFMATHSSFFAMVGVVEQFAMLRNALGSVLGLFGLLKWLKSVLTGRRVDAELGQEFKEFINGKPVQGPPGPPTPGLSRKPIIVFLAAVIGVPYAMHKLIQLIASRTQQPDLSAGASTLPPLTPAELSFARAVYAFTPSSSSELSLRPNEIVAIMAKLDPASGQEIDPRLEIPGCEWWKGRTREGREGWFPRKWVELLERQGENKGNVRSKIRDEGIVGEPGTEGVTDKEREGK